LVQTWGRSAVRHWALCGAFRRRRPNRHFARATEQASAILLAVHTAANDDVTVLEQILTVGGRDVRMR